MTTTSYSDRTDNLAEAVTRLREISASLPGASEEVTRMAAGAAWMGLRLLDGHRMPTSLRRHELVSIPETVTLLSHVRGLQDSGITPADIDGLRDLVASRAGALEAALLSLEDHAMIRMEPGVNLDLGHARLDPERTISAFLARIGRGDPVPEPAEDTPRGVLGQTLFADYTAADLPEEEREETKARIASDPVLKRYTHDELIVISKLRDLVLKIDGYGFGVASRRRPLFSKARRNVLWSAPRIGTIMVTHLPSWHRQPGIGRMLLDLRRYEQHMRDMAMVPEDDDWFDARNPLVGSVRADAWAIHRQGLGIVSEIEAGPSAHRFDAAFFRRMPGPGANYADVFKAASVPVINAMAMKGIGGQGERDRAMADEDLAEARRADRADTGFMDVLKGFFGSP